MSNTLLAFDFGSKSIGVSVGESLIQTANELAPLKARDGIPDWQQIEKLLSEWQPAKVLVGLPLNMDGSDQEMTRRARKFAQRIHGRFRIEVELVDERLTTREAKTIAEARGQAGNYANKPVDSIAARLILESWWHDKQAHSK